MKVYEIMSVTRTRVKGENIKPHWEFHDGPYYHWDYEDAMEELNKLNKEKIIKFDKVNNTAEQVSYQLIKRKATEEEIIQYQEMKYEQEEEEKELQQIEEKKNVATIVKPKSKKKKVEEEERTFLSIKPIRKGEEECQAIEIPY